MSAVRLCDGAVIQVSPEDVALAESRRWRLDRQGYVVAGTRRGAKPRLHRVILQAPAGLQVDHVNGDRLDNRRENLRLATNRQNCSNRLPNRRPGTSRFKGVCWNRKAGKWQASIRVNYRRFHLGVYSDERDAALAYDRAAREHFGEFARPNLGGASNG